MASSIVSTHDDIIIKSTARHRMQGQNRNRYLNSMVSCTKSANQTGLTNSVWTTITFNQEDYDTDTLHDNAVNTSRLTAQIAGKYQVFGTLYIETTNLVGHQLGGIRVLKNGSTADQWGTMFQNTTTAVPGAIITTSFPIQLAANDYIELQSFGGGSSGTYDIFSASTRFGMGYAGE